MEPYVEPRHALVSQVKCEMEPPEEKGLTPFLMLGKLG